MKKISLVLCFIAIIACSAFAQNGKSSKSKFGIKAGYNYSNVIGAKSTFDSKQNNGYMAAVFFAAGTSNGIGYRSEFVYSKQGYSFDDGGKNTDVKNDYLYMPHLMTFTIAKLVQIQAGGQVGILLNAKASNGSKDSSIVSLMNHFDYGFAGGIEVYPIKGLILGARYNLGLGKMYKRYEQGPATTYPLPFNPSTTNLKNGVLQFFIGYRF